MGRSEERVLHIITSFLGFVQRATKSPDINRAKMAQKSEVSSEKRLV